MDASFLTQAFFFGLLPLLGLGYYLGKRQVLSEQYAGWNYLSPVGYYGWYAVIWMLAPAAAFSLVAAVAHMTGVVKAPPTILVAGILAACGFGLLASVKRINPHLRAKILVERCIYGVLLTSSLISILTTLGIVVSIVFEATYFFKLVSIWDFLTGTSWNPDTAFLESVGRAAEDAPKAEFGSVPLFAGTFLITVIAMLVAVPIGLFSAIYMSEYASLPVRRVAKPMLEILAGIPTVVFGFFAAITISPLIVAGAEWLGMSADFNNALSPGLVMGMMIIPFVSSLSDDVITSVPRVMREGALALGATRSEAMKTVILPAAMPGVISAFLLAISRAVGETMIVVMAAGLQANLTINPLEAMTTVTVRIVDALTGDQAFDSPETLSAFGLGLVLLVVTLFLNIISAYVIRRFKKQYE